MRGKAQRFSPKTDVAPLPGSLHAEYARCGKPTCRCAGGDRHGPYWRRFWREGGRTRSQYVRQVDVPAVAAACARYREVHPSGRAFRRQLGNFARRADAVIDALVALQADDQAAAMAALRRGGIAPAEDGSHAAGP